MRMNIGIKQNLKQAVYWYNQASKQNDAQAQCNLGYCYEYGYGLKRNIQEALRLYYLSANQKCNEAFFRLRQCYETGIGATRFIITETM